jgi:hypothetical protein
VGGGRGGRPPGQGRGGRSRVKAEAGDHEWKRRGRWNRWFERRRENPGNLPGMQQRGCSAHFTAAAAGAAGGGTVCSPSPLYAGGEGWGSCWSRSKGLFGAMRGAQPDRMQGAPVCFPASPCEPGWPDAKGIAGPGSKEMWESTIPGEPGQRHATLV